MKMNNIKIFDTYVTSHIPLSYLDQLELLKVENEEDFEDTHNYDDNEEFDDEPDDSDYLFKNNATQFEIKEETAYLVAEQEDDGTWTISSVMSWGQINKVLSGLPLSDMIESMADAEAIYLQKEPYGLSPYGFLPANYNMLPIEKHITTLNQYNEDNNLPENHICRLMLAIGRDKINTDDLLALMQNNSFESEDDTIGEERVTAKDPRGGMLFLN